MHVYSITYSIMLLALTFHFLTPSERFVCTNLAKRMKLWAFITVCQLATKSARAALLLDQSRDMATDWANCARRETTNTSRNTYGEISRDMAMDETNAGFYKLVYANFAKRMKLWAFINVCRLATKSAGAALLLDQSRDMATDRAKREKIQIQRYGDG